MYYAKDAKATTSSTVLKINVSWDILFGVGYSANTSVLPGTFVNGSVYSFLLVVTDSIEIASAMYVRTALDTDGKILGGGPQGRRFALWRAGFSSSLFPAILI